jgi:NAD(P)H-nitrite reductase large subunit
MPIKIIKGESKTTYDKLILTAGAKPFELPINRINSENVFYLRGCEGLIKLRKGCL